MSAPGTVRPLSDLSDPRVGPAPLGSHLVARGPPPRHANTHPRASEEPPLPLGKALHLLWLRVPVTSRSAVPYAGPPYVSESLHLAGPLLEPTMRSSCPPTPFLDSALGLFQGLRGSCLLSLLQVWFWGWAWTNRSPHGGRGHGGGGPRACACHTLIHLQEQPIHGRGLHFQRPLQILCSFSAAFLSGQAGVTQLF